jgi:hypothetical protein
VSRRFDCEEGAWSWDDQIMPTLSGWTEAATGGGMTSKRSLVQIVKRPRTRVEQLIAAVVFSALLVIGYFASLLIPYCVVEFFSLFAQTGGGCCNGVVQTWP